MSLNEYRGKMDSERVKYLVDEYSIDPEIIRQRRAFLGKVWYGLGLERPIDDKKTKTQILHDAIEGARNFDSGLIEGILEDRSPIIKISEGDLSKMQGASNLSIHSNHQAFKDIPYLAQTLRELIGTDSTTHFVMKKGVPFPGYFKSAGGIIVLRGKDLKRQELVNKKRRRAGKNALDIEKERPELIRPKDLPEFLYYFTQQGARNTLIFDKGTRSGDPFIYNDRVVGQMQLGINATLHNIHVLVGINYTGDKPEINIRVLTEDEMRNKKLGDTVNGFLDRVKHSTN